jgi:hypothetical protein
MSRLKWSIFNAAKTNIKLPLPGRRQLRWALILCGLAIWFWLGPEDDQSWPVALLGAVSSVMVGLWWLDGRVGGVRLPPTRALVLCTLAGAVIGTGSAVLAASLMILKNARHAHFFPDYPTGQVLAMLERAPVWGIAGALVGLALGLLLIAFKQEQQQRDLNLPDPSWADRLEP